ncbi:MAG: hypothetical protein JWO05_1121 [Gemmatimonadetes bacterium]|nr:hypothetical protein [Gemmatimonadota bacterium]
MTTRLTRPVRRVVVAQDGTVLIATLTPAGLELREKGRRRAFLYPYGLAYVRAADMAVRAEREQKAAIRKATKRSTWRRR